jgi:hypothetical protein
MLPTTHPDRLCTSHGRAVLRKPCSAHCAYVGIAGGLTVETVPSC